MDTGSKHITSPADVSSPQFPFLPVNFASLVPQYVQTYANRFSDWREELGLQNPGTLEGLHKEVQRDVFVTNYAFSGLKADIARSFCANPLFQVQHSFSAGSSAAAPWSFLSMYATDNVIPFCLVFVDFKIFMQGNLDSDLQLMARCHIAIDSKNVTKIMTQAFVF